MSIAARRPFDHALSLIIIWGIYFATYAIDGNHSKTVIAICIGATMVTLMGGLSKTGILAGWALALVASIFMPQFFLSFFGYMLGVTAWSILTPARK